MAAHRYWRADQFSVYGTGALELAEFGLLVGGTRVDGPATLTASTAPSTGTLSNLQDANGATVATWAASATLVLTWDLGGSPADVDDVRLHSLVDWLKFPYRVRVQWSDDGSTWTTYTLFTGITWPGPRAQTTSVSRNLNDGTSGTFIAVDVARGGALLPPALTAPTSAHTGPFGVYLLQGGRGRNDYQQVLRGRGVGRVAGTVKDKATPPPHTPVRERVRLYEQLSGRLVREMISNGATGAYSFDYVDETLLYYVVALDKEGAYRAVIADNLTPEIIS